MLIFELGLSALASFIIPAIVTETDRKQREMASLRNSAAGISNNGSLPTAAAIEVNDDENISREPFIDPGDGGRKDHKGGSFHLTTAGASPTYWGRFNDPHAEVVNNADDDTTIPVATARPDDRQVRLNFIRKVYTILSAQLLVTFAVCAWINLYEPMRTFALGTGLGLHYINLILTMVSICGLHAYKVSHMVDKFERELCSPGLDHTHSLSLFFSDPTRPTTTSYPSSR